MYMNRKIIIDGNSIYEIDEECLARKEKQEQKREQSVQRQEEKNQKIMHQKR